MDLVEQYHNDGCIVVPGFSTQAECEAMKVRMKKLVDDWDGKCECTFSTEEKSQNEGQGESDYFFNSSKQIRFFLEADAVDKSTGNIIEGVEKLSSINKVGHGLHLKDPVFRDYSFSPKVKKLVKSLGYKDPVLPQSMYIMKNARIGGEVPSHQDSTFLFTEPKLTCLGLWLALDDATLENGCLWARLGSHKGPLFSRWRRSNPETRSMSFKKFVADDELEELSSFHGKTLRDITKEQLKEAGYTPLPCKAGDLVLIHGEVEHLSLPNTSTLQRHTFQLHLVEGQKQGIHWSDLNWLQYPRGEFFPSLSVDN